MSLMIYDGMVDFGHNTNNQLNAAIVGKTVERFDIDDDRMDSFLVLSFTDGTRLRIRYDYIYEWRLERGEHGTITED